MRQPSPDRSQRSYISAVPVRADVPAFACLQLRNIVIPRPPAEGQLPPPGLGKVIIEYADVNGAVAARDAMNGRKFAGRTVVATFLPEEQYAAGQF